MRLEIKVEQMSVFETGTKLTILYKYSLHLSIVCTLLVDRIVQNEMILPKHTKL